MPYLQLAGPAADGPAAEPSALDGCVGGCGWAAAAPVPPYSVSRDDMEYPEAGGIPHVKMRGKVNATTVTSAHKAGAEVSTCALRRSTRMASASVWEIHQGL
jgi:hypothetical protein